MKFQAYKRIKWEDIPYDVRAEISNGCGGKGSFIKPPLAVFFKTCCDHHDYGYAVGCTEADRLKADIKLKEMMQKDCKRLPWYKQILYRPWCRLYYYAVRLGGKKYFYYGPMKHYPII